MKVAFFFVCCFAAALGDFTMFPLTHADLSSTEFRRVIELATLEMNRVTNNSLFHSIFNIVQGVKHVVVGIPYRYEFSALLGRTKCKNDDAKNQENLANCTPIRPSYSSEYQCTFNVVYRPLYDQIVSRPICISIQAGLSPEDQPAFKQLEEAVKAASIHFNMNSNLDTLYINEFSNWAFPYKIEVDGKILYSFETDLHESDCLNTPRHINNISGCYPTGKKTVSCRYNVFYKPNGTPEYSAIDLADCKEKF